MPSENSQVVVNYESRCAKMFARPGMLLAKHDWTRGFWQRWVLVHSEVLRLFLDHSLRNDVLAQRYEKAAEELLEKRKRMVSSLAQGLRVNKGETLLRMQCAELVIEHDVEYSQIVLIEFEKLKAELSHAHVAKKTLSAYARTVQY